MSSTHVSAAECRSPVAAFRRFAACLSLLALCAPSAGVLAATPGKTYFFATRDACVASGAFGPRECAAAFSNARLQLEDRAPRFSTAGECRLKFRLCEATRAAPQEGDAMAYAATEPVAYTPMALGVEMTATAKGAESAPTLAVDTRARLFPYHPVSRVYDARRGDAAPLESAAQNPAILAADRFEPFSKRKPADGASTFTASALGAIEGMTHDAISSESPAERRARLKAAPFIQ